MRNIDGISKIKSLKKRPISGNKNHRIIIRHAFIKISPPEVFYTGFFASLRQHLKMKLAVVFKQTLNRRSEFLKKRIAWVKAEFRQFNGQKKAVPIYAIVVAFMLAFGGGAWVALNTQTIEAENYEPTQAGSIPLAEVLVASDPINKVSNEVLFNMTIGQLENYLNSIAEQNRQIKQAEIMATRKEKLHAYLESKKTPFAEFADIIAEQKHWKLILAISFAESTFGRNCVDNNCSNIGVKPGHPYWHKYATLGEWVKDFNRLIEKRYSDWTLEQMNGVYVQPKNPNWLAATRQVLEELQELGVE